MAALIILASISGLSFYFLGASTTTWIICAAAASFYAGLIVGMSSMMAAQSTASVAAPAQTTAQEPVVFDPPVPIDAAEAAYIFSRSIPEGPVFGMVYRAADWEVTHRIVSLIDIEDDNHFVAWCYLREEIRHFRNDRCFLFYDPFTGETFDTFDVACAQGVHIQAMCVERFPRKKPTRRQRKNGT